MKRIFLLIKNYIRFYYGKISEIELLLYNELIGVHPKINENINYWNKKDKYLMILNHTNSTLYIDYDLIKIIFLKHKNIGLLEIADEIALIFEKFLIKKINSQITNLNVNKELFPLEYYKNLQ